MKHNSGRRRHGYDLRFSATLLLALMMSLFSPFASAGVLAADGPGSFYQEDGSRYFPETNRTVSGRFLDYWQRNGGLFTFGYPISDPFEERNWDDGKTYLVQYFERNRFELHLENQGSQYEVLIARFGALLTTNRSSEAAFKPVAAFQGTAERMYLQETGHSLSGGFLRYWQQHGGMAIFGFPISEVFEEVSPTDGQRYQVQYFERNRFEYHPENNPPYDILLGLLGSEFLKNPPVVTSPVTPVSKPAPAANPAPSLTPAPTGNTPTPSGSNPSSGSTTGSSSSIKVISTTLNGVKLNLNTPFLPDTFFTVSQPDAGNQVATSVNWKPYRELSITAVPFGSRPGTEKLPVAQANSEQIYRDGLRDLRISQNGNPQIGPTATLFGKSVIAQSSLVKLNLDSAVLKPTLIVEWVVEANNTLWIIRVAQEQNSSSPVQPGASTLVKDLSQLSLSTSEFKQSNLQDYLALNTTASATFASAADTTTDLPFPSWWDGDCDNRNYSKDPATKFKASHPLGSSYRGVQSCGPRPYFDYGKDANGNYIHIDGHSTKFPGSNVEVLEWQCVELSMRFMKLAYQVNPYPANGNQVVWSYKGDILHPLGNNGTPGTIPQPGDILSYGSTAGEGHTSVVKTVAVDSSGTGLIGVIDQNNQADGTHNVSVKNWKLYAWTTINGWLTPGNVDTIAPVTTLTHNGTPGKYGTFINPVTITLTAQDEAGGSGVDYTEYSFDGITWTKYSAPFTLSISATVYYRSVDKAGNKEATKQQSFKFARVVTSAADTDSEGTLRYHLNRAQNNDVIYFNIAGDGLHTIKLTSPLPVVKQDGLVIDATTENGTLCGSELKVTLAGRKKFATGLEITGKNVALAGLNLNGFTDQQIWLNGANAANLECNFLGTNATGTRAANGSEEADVAAPIGLRITNGGNSTIGSTAPGMGNLIAGNIYTLVKITNSPTNKLIGNIIGADREGKKVIGDPIEGKRKVGVLIEPGSNNTLLTQNLLVGQVTANLRVVGANNTQIVGNQIGMDKAETKGLGQIIVENGLNIAHIVLEGGAKNSLIKDNVLSNYNHTVIMVAGQGSDNTVINGNLIGLSKAGKVLAKQVANLDTVGIWVKNGPLNTEISANTIVGIYTGMQLSGKETGKATIKGNYIGTSADGKLKAGNTFGIWIFEQASNNLIKGNTIVGGEEAVKIGTEPQDAAQGNTISQNIIDGNRKGGIVFANDNYGNGTLNGQSEKANRDAARPNAELISATLSGGKLVVTGQANATNFNSMVEVFLAADNAEFPQGKTYLGTVKAKADGSFELELPAGTVTVGTKLVVTSTLVTGDTSAFSQELKVKA